MVQKMRGKMRPVRLMYARQLSPKVSSIIRCSLEMRPKNKIPKPTMPEKAGNPVRQQQCLSDSPTR